MPVLAARFMPGYAVMIALACVGGACSDDGHQPQTDQQPATEPHDCPPCPERDNNNNNNNPSHTYMDVEINGLGLSESLCNNATFTWMVHTMLAEVARGKEELEERSGELEECRGRLDEAGHVEDWAERADRMVDDLRNEVENLRDERDEILWENKRLRVKLLRLRQGQKDDTPPTDCADVQYSGNTDSGVYTIFPKGYSNGLQVFCDLSNDHGGWLVIQRRADGSQDFAQDWTTYKEGFGNIEDEFYLGNDNIHQITHQQRYMLRIDLVDYEGESAYASYGRFSIEDEKELYRLKIGQFSGTAGDSLSHHNRVPFSTYDQDNDQSTSGHCSKMFGRGGGWFVRCYDANLNGQYGADMDNKGVVWFRWKDTFHPLQFVEMKIRPIHFLH